MRRWSVLILAAAGCASPASPTATTEVSLPAAASGAASSPAASASVVSPADATKIAEGDDVRPGYISFTGMITPAKDGFHVRGVTVTEKLRDRMKDTHDVTPTDPDWFLGAKVTLTGRVVQREDHPMSEGGIVSQGHEGAWLAMDAVDGIELVAMPVVVEGTLTRSKGLFQIGEYLVTKDDLAWSLVSTGGGKEGDRVRLFGQPRVHHCDPRAQCLSGGSIPLLDVGRAQKL